MSTARRLREGGEGARGRGHNDGKTKSRLRHESEGASRLPETLTPDFHWLVREDGSPHPLLLADIDPDVHEGSPAHSMPRRGVTSGAQGVYKLTGNRGRHSCTSATVPTRGKDGECKREGGEGGEAGKSSKQILKFSQGGFNGGVEREAYGNVGGIWASEGEDFETWRCLGHQEGRPMGTWCC